MIQHVTYTPSDIEKFLEINALANEEEQTASLRKLLNVQGKISIFKNIDPLELKAIVYDLKFMKYR